MSSRECAGAAFRIWRGVQSCGMCRRMTIRNDLWTARVPIAGFCAIGVVWGSIAALVPDLKPQVGLSDAQFGTAMLVAACGTISAIVLSPWADRQMDRQAMMILILILAICVLFPGQATGWGAFAVAMLAVSMLSGTLDVVLNVRLSAYEAKGGRPLMNLGHGMFSVAYALSAFSTGLLREAGLSPMMIFAIGAAVLVGLAKVSAGDQVGSQAGDAPPVATPVPPVLVAIGGAILLVAFMSEQAIEAWAALHLERGLGASPAGGALGPTILGLTMALGRFGGQWIIRYLDEPRLIALACTVAAAGTGIAAFAPGVPLAYLGFAIAGLGVSVVVPMAYAWIARLVDADKRARVISRISVIGYAGFFIGPPLMGGLSEWSGLWLSFTVIALTLIAVPLCLVPVLARMGAKG